MTAQCTVYTVQRMYSVYCTAYVQICLLLFLKNIIRFKRKPTLLFPLSFIVFYTRKQIILQGPDLVNREN